jgi:protein-disulfide isomerase
MLADIAFPLLNRRAILVGLPVVMLVSCAKAVPPVGDDVSLGDPKAPVKVVEYASVACPVCGRWYREVFAAFKAKYIDTGKVHYVFRELLTAPAEVAAASFLIARCAGKDKYFSVLDTIFRGQEQMYQSGDIKGALAHAASLAGMSEAQFDACLTNQAAGEALNARVDHYTKVDGINTTPTFVINGKKMEADATLANLDAAIAAAH